MTVEDCKTKPLAVVGCLSVVCGLTALVAGRLHGAGWTIHGCSLAVVVWVGLEWLWHGEHRVL